MVEKLMRNGSLTKNPCCLHTFLCVSWGCAAYFESFAGGYTNLPSRSSHLRSPDRHKNSSGMEQRVPDTHVPWIALSNWHFTWINRVVVCIYRQQSTGQ